MTRRRVIIGITILLVLVVNGIILSNRFRRADVKPHGSRVAHLGQEQVKQVLEWEKLPVVPLKDSLEEVEQVIENYSQTSCPDIPEGASTIAFNQLTPEQKANLVSAMATLSQAYEASNASAIVSYMKDRDEKLDPTFAGLLKKILVEEAGSKPDKVKRFNDESLLSTYWQVAECDSHWKAIVKQAGCVSVWQSRKSDQSKQLGISTRKLFRNETTYQHIFRPRFSLEDAQKEFGEVLMANVMVVIQHDKSLRNERCPYFFQFWYSEKDKQWHPLRMKRVSSLDTSVKIIF